MKASVQSRIIAKIIDLLIVFAVGVFLPRLIGPLLGFAYSLVADGLNVGKFKGQSIGKKIIGIQVRSASRDHPIRFKESAIRNAPVGLATFFAIIPIWGWIILALVGIPLMAMEIYLMMRMDSKERLGDVMADTRVVFLREKRKTGAGSL